jgi:dihydroorotate dehydrogenase electron transfer subunit
MSAAPSFVQVTAPVFLNQCLARDTFLIRLQAPAIAAAIRPGQFVMLRLPGSTDPLLGRPFALYDTVLDEHDSAIGLDIVYLVVGKVTGLMSQMQSGETVEIWGPLGNGFPEPLGTKHVALVAGGIGQTPFLAHIRELLGTRGYGGQTPRRRVEKVSLYYGVRSADLAAGVEDFRAAGADLHLTSNDGTLGYRGFVTDLLAQSPLAEHLFGCGPEPMLRALAQFAASQRVPCHLSLETPMACGVGICFSCVTPVKVPGAQRGVNPPCESTWDYKRVCVEGPVFDAATLAWPPESH